MHRQALLIAFLLSVPAGPAFAQERRTEEADSLKADSSRTSSMSARLLRQPPPAWLRPLRLRPLTPARPGDLSLPVPSFDEGQRFVDALSAALAMQIACGDDWICQSDLGRGLERQHGRLRWDADILASLLANFVGADGKLYDSHLLQRRKDWP